MRSVEQRFIKMYLMMTLISIHDKMAKSKEIGPPLVGLENSSVGGLLYHYMGMTFSS